MSPTWCAILKHTQVSANFLSQMRLDQCALIDRYTDSRTDDYYRERQECVRQKIADNGGNLEQAMGECQGGVYGANLANWAGQSGGGKTPVSKLIESSAKWAGLSGPEATRTTDLLKAFVGDTVVASGNVSVELPVGGEFDPGLCGTLTRAERQRRESSSWWIPVNKSPSVRQVFLA